MARITETQRRAIFGQPCTISRYTTVTTPWGLRATCHNMLVDPFLESCRIAANLGIWTPRRIDSYVCRQIRGSSSWSLHAYALAWDFFDKPFPEPVDVWGQTNAPPAAFRKVFKDRGFFLGADFSSRKDYPHIEWADGVPAPISPEEANLRVPNPVAAHHRPGHGPEQFAIIAKDGSMWAFNGAPWIDAYNAHPELWGGSSPTTHRAAIGFAWDSDGRGYAQYMDDGATYHWRMS